MRWTPGGRSEGLEDRRGTRVIRTGAGIGIGTVLILGLLSLITGQNLMGLLGPLSQITGGGDRVQTVDEPVQTSPQEEERIQFVSFVLDDAQNTWRKKFSRDRATRDAKLVLFRDAVQIGCGYGQAAIGPFYCPLDQKVYIDLCFYDELQQRFGATGEFAQAYVLAHEIGHHVQNLLGIDGKVRARAAAASRPPERALRPPRAAGRLPRRRVGPLDEPAPAPRAGRRRGRACAPPPRSATTASRSRPQGYVQPESFTHGSSAQRVEWFKRGFQSGDLNACDTFKG